MFQFILEFQLLLHSACLIFSGQVQLPSTAEGAAIAVASGSAASVSQARVLWTNLGMGCFGKEFSVAYSMFVVVMVVVVVAL